MKKRSENTSSNSIWKTAPLPSGSELFPLNGLEAGHFYAYEDYLVSRDFHDSFIMVYTISGCGKVEAEGKTMLLEKNQAVVIDCHSPHSYGSYQGKWEFLWLHFSGSFSNNMYDFLYQKDLDSITISNTEFNDIFNEIISSLELFDNYNRFKISTSIQKLFLLLSDSRSSGEDSISKKDQLVEKAIELMEANFNQPLTIQQLSGQLNISNYHFIRVFKKVTGLSPYNYLTVLRISKAKKYLVETSYSVEDISDLCGFNDTTNFITKFKGLTGETPLKYRRNFKY